MERYYSYVVKILAFGTSHERGFLVFGVSNAKYLAFNTSDENALTLNGTSISRVVNKKLKIF